jgi:hypothetical protein
MSSYEAVMLLCFGASWPISILRSYTARSNAGKSFWFLAVVLAGYSAGILHKYYYDLDAVIWLYIINAALVLVDIAIYFRNARVQSRLRA